MITKNNLNCNDCNLVFNEHYFDSKGIPKYDHKNRESVYNYAKKLEGQTLRDVCGEVIISDGIKKTAKGKFGSDLEKFYFGYENNFDHSPDFSELGVEVKSTGVIPDSRPDIRGYFQAKERISLAVVDFPNIETQSFEESLWKKIKDPLFVLYDYTSAKNDFDKKIILVDFYQYSQFEKEIIFSEWKIIRDVVVNHGGQEVSQGKLGHRYLEPTTTGANKKVRVKNRLGLPDCKPRRFAFPNHKTQPYGQANRIVKKLLNYNVDFIES